MFDARSLLESIMGGGRQAQQPQQGGGLGDILGQLQRQLGQSEQGGQGAQGSQGGGGLADILGQLQRQLGQQGQGGQPGQGGRSYEESHAGQPQSPNAAPGGDLGDLMRNIFPGGDQAQGRSAGRPDDFADDDRGGMRGGRELGQGRAGEQGAGGQGGGLDDILGQLQRHLGGERGAAGAGRGGEDAGYGPQGGPGGAGSLFDMLGKVLGQASQGAREGAGRIGEATGANDALGRMTGGRSGEDILGQLKDLIENNKLGAGVAAGGLGALVLGTRTGRSVASSAARIGALALIGGLAYKALQNYQAGRPLISGADPIQPAPQGTGFEADAVTNDTATLYLQAMIAAAAADGRLDDAEQARIMSGLQQAGAAEGAEEFIAEEFNNPSDPEALADGVQTEEQAVQLYTAARLAIDPDTDAEKQFLARLAATLELDPKLVAHVDASARNVA